MIQEDYVSFEVAKLLKKKGFDWECIGYYVDYEPNDIKYSFLGETNSTWESRCCSAPTLQMAMKYLREVHKYLIVIGNKNENYLYLIKDLKSNTDLGISNNEYIRYEEACEAAIKYCLENLI